MKNHLKRVAFIGLKNSTGRDIDLYPLTIIQGPSASGKTAVLNAIRLGLVGHEPTLGKTAAATMRLANGSQLWVTLEDSAGGKNVREWNISRGKVSATAECSIPEVPPILMDPEEYFRLGAKDRVRYVFDRADLSGLNIGLERLTEAVEAIKIADADERLLRAKLDVKAGVVAHLAESDRERHDIEQPNQEWLENILTHYTERAKTARQQADRMAKAVQASTALGTVSTAQNRRDDIKSLNAEIEEEVAKIARYQIEKREHDARVARRGQLTALLAAQPPTIPDAPTLPQCPTPAPAPDLSAAMAEVQSLESAEPQRINEAPVLERLAENKAKLAAAQAEVARLGYEIKAKQNAVRQTLQNDCCPTCRSAGEMWKPTFTNAANEELRLLTDRCNVAEIESASLSSEIQVIEMERAQDVEQNARHNRWAAARLAAASALDRLRVAAESIERANASQLAAWHTACETARNQHDAAKRNAQQSEARRAAAQAELDAMGPETPFDNTLEREAQAAADKLRATVAQHQREHDQWVRAQHEMAQEAKAADERAAQLAEAEILKEAVKIIEAVKAEMVNSVINSLLTTANRVWRAVTGYSRRDELVFRDGSISSFDLVTLTTVEHEAFSGTEKALLYAGLSAALAVNAPLRIVMIDELGRMDHGTIGRLMDAMRSLIDAGLIDQFVGCYSGHIPRPDVDGLTVVEIA